MMTARSFKPIPSSPAGFTMLETILAMGLAGLVLLAAYEIYSGYTAKFREMADTLETSIDIETAQQIMFRDLKAVNPSFGTMVIPDDQEKNFFEYFPDVPESSLAPDPICGRACRTYTMRAVDGHAEILFLLEDSAPCDIPSMVYDPTLAFQMFAPRTLNADGAPPVFKGLNSGGAVENVRGNANNCPLPKKGYWQAGQLLMLDSPSLFRPTASNLASVAPRAPSFVGYVPASTSEIHLVPLASARPDPLQLLGFNHAPTATQVLNVQHPLFTTPKAITSDEEFLRWLPPFSGGQPLVRLRPVRLVKYSVEEMYPGTPDPSMAKAERERRQGAMRLWKQVFVPGKSWDQTKKFLLAENVKTVQFTRPTITDQTILFNISKDKLKRGGEN